MESEFDKFNAAFGKAPHSEPLPEPAPAPAPTTKENPAAMPTVPKDNAGWDAREEFVIEHIGITNAIALLEADNPEAHERFLRFERFVSIDPSNQSWSWKGGPAATVVALVAKCMDATADNAMDYLETFVKSNPDCLDILHPGGLRDDFPVECLPKVLRTMVDTIIKIHGAPPQLPAALAIGAISTALGKGIKLKTVRGLAVYGNTYIVGAGESGTGKSVVADLVFGPLYAFEEELKAIHHEKTEKIKRRLTEIAEEMSLLEDRE